MWTDMYSSALNKLQIVLSLDVPRMSVFIKRDLHVALIDLIIFSCCYDPPPPPLTILHCKKQS